MNIAEWHEVKATMEHILSHRTYLKKRTNKSVDRAVKIFNELAEIENVPFRFNDEYSVVLMPGH
jgi:hypothetical protein